MLTPQEVSNRAFTKAMMGGYNMAMVDEFLDEVTDDYTALFKENAALKAKMKVLVDKVEEYRATEEAMRAALLTAQKMANTIVEDAEKQKQDMLAQAERQAREKLSSLQAEVTVQQERLGAGKRELAEFIRASKTLCEKQVSFLAALPELPVEAQRPAAAPAVEAVAPADEVASIEEKILSSFDQELFPAPEEAPVEEGQAKPAADSAAPVPEEDPFLEHTRTINLKDLKFGRNYSHED